MLVLIGMSATISSDNVIFMLWIRDSSCTLKFEPWSFCNWGNWLFAFLIKFEIIDADANSRTLGVELSCSFFCDFEVDQEEI